MKIIIVYDDTGEKSELISDIIGNKGFGDVVVKKKLIEDYYKQNIKSIFTDVEWIKIKSKFEYPELIKTIEKYKDESSRVIHCYSNYIFSDSDVSRLSFEKLKYVDEPYRVEKDGKVVAAMFSSVKEYMGLCESAMSENNSLDFTKLIVQSMEVQGMNDISEIGNFIQCITGNFDSRYFNSLRGNEYTIVKTSTNKKKIKAEYKFYHLLPEDMKYWFVMPFNYCENDETASYTMERLHMTDLAIKWVHGSMRETEFEELMDKYFYFFTSRHSRECGYEEYNRIAKSLYEDKVNERIDELKGLPQFIKIKKLLDVSDQIDIDKLVDKYFELKRIVEKKNKYQFISVIGHGDPCFANSMYNKATKTLKFIDPKGALTEEELWTNAYYDVAKLSHSVCGRYDFFNNALFDISINENLDYKLDIPFDNSVFKEIFRKKAEQNGFDYMTIRIYEASLFLSMLPLHIDNPHKVLGFILNVKNILEEIENNV